jgi:hypothetical protein
MVPRSPNVDPNPKTKPRQKNKSSNEAHSFPSDWRTRVRVLESESRIELSPDRISEFERARSRHEIMW